MSFSPNPILTHHYCKTLKTRRTWKAWKTDPQILQIASASRSQTKLNSCMSSLKAGNHLGARLRTFPIKMCYDMSPIRGKVDAVHFSFSCNSIRSHQLKGPLPTIWKHLKWMCNNDECWHLYWAKKMKLQPFFPYLFWSGTSCVRRLQVSIISTLLQIDTCNGNHHHQLRDK